MSRWDSYFLGLCTAVSNNVVCPSRSIGVVIAKGKAVVSTGYNGPPSGFPHPGSQPFRSLIIEDRRYSHQEAAQFMHSNETCPRRVWNIPSGQKLSLCPCAHAERNAISQAAKMGHATEGCTLYMNSCIPCLDCAYSIVAAGIIEVVVSSLDEYPQPGFTGKIILSECGIEVRQFDV